MSIFCIKNSYSPDSTFGLVAFWPIRDSYTLQTNQTVCYRTKILIKGMHMAEWYSIRGCGSNVSAGSTPIVQCAKKT